MDFGHKTCGGGVVWRTRKETAEALADVISGRTSYRRLMARIHRYLPLLAGWRLPSGPTPPQELSITP